MTIAVDLGRKPTKQTKGRVIFPKALVLEDECFGKNYLKKSSLPSGQVQLCNIEIFLSPEQSVRPVYYEDVSILNIKHSVDLKAS